MNKRLFIDMDGTLAHFNNVEKLESLYEQGYFLSLAPHRNLVEAIRELNSKPNVDVFILSAVLEESLYARQEKTQWLSSYLPEIKPEQIIFTPCGHPKSDYIQNLSRSDLLIDDYTVNLNEWVKSGGSGMKFVNRVNSKHGTWKGKRIQYYSAPQSLVYYIVQYLNELPSPKVEDRRQESRSDNKNRIVKPSVFQCAYHSGDLPEIKHVYIAAYDEIDAQALFQLHMRDKDRLIEDSISSFPVRNLNPKSYCLNFDNPVIQKDAPEF